MKTSDTCCDASDDLRRFDRRQFLKTSALSVGAGVASVSSGGAAKAKAPESETLVTTLFKSLSEEQKEAIVFPFDHDLRFHIDNNWHITKQRLSSKFYTKDQQAMVKEIFMKLHSPEYADRVYKAVEHDGGQSGFGDCSIALFGEPGTGKFEFVLSGRHCTRRCDGDSVEGAAFGGPIFYGHSVEDDEAPDHPGNAYWYQAKRANFVFDMLDGKQQETALLDKRSRFEQKYKTVRLTGQKEGLDGIRLSELSRDQRREVRRVLEDILAPYRQEDVKEAMELIRANGMKNLHMAFYKNQDVGDDGVWDVWQIEGPSMICYFRGDPHVHAYLNVKKAPDELDKKFAEA